MRNLWEFRGKAPCEALFLDVAYFTWNGFCTLETTQRVFMKNGIRHPVPLKYAWDAMNYAQFFVVIGR